VGRWRWARLSGRSLPSKRQPMNGRIKITEQGEWLARKVVLARLLALYNHRNHDHRCAPEQPGEHQPRRHPQLERADWPGCWRQLHVALPQNSSTTIWDLVAFFQQVTPIEEISKSLADFQSSGAAQERGQGSSPVCGRPLGVRLDPRSRFCCRVGVGRAAALQENSAVTRAAGAAAAALPALAVLSGLLISKVEMTLSKVDLDWPIHYVEKRSAPGNIALPSKADFRGDRRRVHPHPRFWCCKISAMAACLDGDPACISVDLRNRTIIPWAFVQVALLRRLRDQKPPATDERSERRQPRQPHLQRAARLLAGSAADESTGSAAACATRG